MNQKSRFQTFIITCAGVIVFSAVQSALAQTPITVPNFSFEAPATGSFQNNNGLAAGSPLPNMGNSWYYLGGFADSGSPVGVENTASNSGSIGGLGTQNGYLNKGSNLGSAALITISANTTYTLTVAEARRGGGFAQTGGFIIALGYGATAGSLPSIGASQFFTLPATVGVFSDYTVSFTTGEVGDEAIGQNLFVVLSSEATAGANPVDFDNVRVTAVPEPSSMVVFIGAAGMLLMLSRRRIA